MTQASHSPSLFDEKQWQALQQFLRTLDAQQTQWLGSYLRNSSDTTARRRPAPTVPLIAFGTETNNCRQLAQRLAQICSNAGIPSETGDLAGTRVRRLQKLDTLIIITATHGDGDPPEPVTSFYEEIMSDDAPRLEGLQFAVLALGDSSYEQFCLTGIELDRRLEQLGGIRLLARQDCDVDYEQAAATWMQALLEVLPKPARRTVPSAAVPPPARESGYSRENPASLEVLINQRLSNPTRSAPIHHLELALDDIVLDLQPGDAVGVFVSNPPALVALVLDSIGLSGDQAVTLAGKAYPLVEVLRQHRDLCIPGKPFLTLWASLSGAGELQAVLESDAQEQRQYLSRHQVRDFLRKFPATPDPQAFVDALRPLQPRLYDMANEPGAGEDELHLTVKCYQYAMGERLETGIASQYLLELQPGDTVQLYPHRNARFRLPEDRNAPLILIAEGTGIAPYRSFLQALAARRQASPPSWLVFAEMRFEEDFLYQVDIQKAHREGHLSHVDTLFYEDTPGASLADPLLACSARLREWLDMGAHLYFCGSKTALSHCETALRTHLDEQSGGTLWATLGSEKRIHRNLY